MLLHPCRAASPRDQEIKPQALKTEDGEIKVNTRRSQEGKITDVETRSEPKDPAIAGECISPLVLMAGSCSENMFDASAVAVNVSFIVQDKYQPPPVSLACVLLSDIPSRVSGAS